MGPSLSINQRGLPLRGLMHEAAFSIKDGLEERKMGRWRVITRQLDLGGWYFFEDQSYVDALAGVVGFANVVDHDA